MKAIKVKLRQKEISGNRQSLYLDFYPPIPHPTTGKPTRREFLGRYVYEKAKNALAKQHNKEALQFGEEVRQKRQNQLNKPEIYTGYELEQLRIRELGEKNFVEYFKKLADKREGSNHGNWASAYNYLDDFTDGQLKFADLNERFCSDFKEYLQITQSLSSAKKKLAINSTVSYFNKLKAAMKQAYKDGYLSSDLNVKIEPIKSQDVIKQTLTLEELRALAKTRTENERMKRAALFSALTGMPFKEMQNLEWAQIETSETFGIRIKTVRQKTGKPYIISIGEQAYELLGERRGLNQKVFDGLNNRDRYYFFPLWLAHAGIDKSMTFHDLRHTYGCLQVELGTDLYTIQGNMGQSTQRQAMHYAKISDQRKREAADKIKLDP
ncbi:MAG: site-specific integrase [Flavobacteriales bacterium]|nr:site-specific integrase [Flavobacteriales bacterium]